MVTLPARYEERRVALIVGLIKGGMGGEQRNHAAAVPVNAGDHQRCQAPLVCPVCGGAGGKQQLHAVNVALVAGGI